VERFAVLAIEAMARGRALDSLVAAKTLSGDVGELRRARALRLEADRNAAMSERLARMHALCKQMSAIKGAARAP